MAESVDPRVVDSVINTLRSNSERYYFELVVANARIKALEEDYNEALREVKALKDQADRACSSHDSLDE